ncbi:MAG: glycosyltransferase family 39 protein [Chloroflexota bacterium]
MGNRLAASSIQTRSNRIILTWEQLFYGIALLCAAVLRFSNLGVVPLSPEEAENGWGVWQYWQPEVADSLPEVSSAAWFSLTALLTQVGGYSDLLMRLFPAIAGILAIIAVTKLRAFTGRLGGVIAAFVLAISPLMVSISRMATGDSLAILSLILSIGFFLEWQANSTNRSIFWLAGWLGFGLTTSPVFYSGLLAFGFAYLLQSLIGSKIFSQFELPEDDARTRTIAIFAAVFVLSATMFLLNLGGIGAFTNILETWFLNFGGFSDLSSIADPLFSLLQYETIIFVVGIAAVLVMGLFQDHTSSFLAYWMIGSLLLFVVQVGELSNALIFMLPAALIVGRALDQVISQVPLNHLFSTYPDGGMGLPLAGICGLLLLIAATNLGRFSRTGFDQSLGQAHYFLFLVCVVLVIAMLVTITIYDRLSGTIGFLTTCLLISAVYGWGTAWRLSNSHANDTRERWVTLASDSEIRLLNDTLDEAGESIFGFEQSLEIYSTVDNSVLRWYLRDYPEVQFVSAVTPETVADAIITPDNVELQAGSDYTGSDFGLLLTDQDPDLQFRTRLRWWLYGESNTDLIDSRIILWLRTDLVR